MKDFVGKTVLVTGGTRGIGAAIAGAFAEQGAELVVTGRDPDRVAELNALGQPHRRYIATDFADRASLDVFLGEIEQFERLDACVNNAGINIINSIEDVRPEDLDRITAVNYTAPYLICRAASRVMLRGGGGRIVNIGSIWSLVAKRGRSAYAASKAGLAGMTRAVAIDLAPEGVLVNCVSPGFVLTDLSHSTMSDGERDTLAETVPVGRFAEPAEIAPLVLFLCSDANTYITGQNIAIDGGFTNV